MSDDYRAWVTIADVPVDDEDRWEPVIEFLEREYSDMGPVMAREDNMACLVLSGEAEDPQEFARQAADAVVQALRAAGWVDKSPMRVFVELADETRPIDFDAALRAYPRGVPSVDEKDF